ncbi:hypothetical protein HDV00_010521 [Rhizophlyctis rosea]|nr:hypothetical protein HDV00_010521 [Rhizophlyctis rosea]
MPKVGGDDGSFGSGGRSGGGDDVRGGGVDATGSGISDTHPLGHDPSLSPPSNEGTTLSDGFKNPQPWRGYPFSIADMFRSRVGGKSPLPGIASKDVVIVRVDSSVAVDSGGGTGMAVKTYWDTEMALFYGRFGWVLGSDSTQGGSPLTIESVLNVTVQDQQQQNKQLLRSISRSVRLPFLIIIMVLSLFLFVINAYRSAQSYWRLEGRWPLDSEDLGTPPYKSILASLRVGTWFMIVTFFIGLATKFAFLKTAPKVWVWYLTIALAVYAGLATCFTISIIGTSKNALPRRAAASALITIYLASCIYYPPPNLTVSMSALTNILEGEIGLYLINTLVLFHLAYRISMHPKFHGPAGTPVTLCSAHIELYPRNPLAVHGGYRNGGPSFNLLCVQRSSRGFGRCFQ